MTHLVILAAGLGSRFGGNKQLAEFGANKQTLMEFNIAHAINAGFTELTLIIRPELLPLLEHSVLSRLPKILKINICYQALTQLPEHALLPANRTKPLGTAHAIWCARKFTNSKFAVINADDYYGPSAFGKMAQAIATPDNNHLLVAFTINNTLSAFGGVNRGICQLNQLQQLQSIRECCNISIKGEQLTGEFDEGNTSELESDSLVSMNCWVFTQDIFAAIANELSTMFDANQQVANDAQQLKRECYLPTVVMKQIAEHNKRVDVVCSNDQWLGLTYQQDMAQIEQSLC